MSETNNPLAWVEKAEEDFTLAQSALKRKNPLDFIRNRVMIGGC